MEETYPGLIACFRRGYSVLLNDNFFATKGKDLSKLGFADRLNLKAKLGSRGKAARALAPELRRLLELLA